MINISKKKIYSLWITTISVLVILIFSGLVHAQNESTVYETILKIEGNSIKTDRQHVMILNEGTVIMDLNSVTISLGDIKLPVNAEITMVVSGGKPPQVLKIILNQTKESIDPY